MRGRSFTAQKVFIDVIIYYNMPELVKVTIRRVGSSLGVLIPKKVIEEERLKEGDAVEIALYTRSKEERLKILKKAFGIAKGAKPFVREYEEDRV